MAQISFKDLLLSLSEWVIVRFLDTLDQQTLLLVDGDMLAPLNKYGQAKFRASTDPAAIKGTTTDIIVFRREGELAMVRALRQQYPRKRVLSFAYDICPAFPHHPRYDKAPDVVRRKANEPTARILLVAMTGSEPEYLAELCAQNGLGRPREFLGRPFIALARWYSDFRPLRYILSVLRANPAAGDHMIVQHDCLNALPSIGISEARQERLLASSGLKLVYLGRRDKIFQAAFSIVFADPRARSFWSAPQALRPIIVQAEIKTERFMDTLLKLVREEYALEARLAKHGHLKMFLFEDLLSGPQEVLRQLGLYCAIKQGKTFTPVDYWEKGCVSDEKFSDRLDELRRDLVDRLGLQVNVSGSLTGKTDAIRLSQQS